MQKVVTWKSNGNELAKANKHVHEDVEKMALIQVDATTWLVAAEIGAALKVCLLDAVHLACARRLRIRSLRFVTFEIRQEVSGRALGFAVVGV